jgi:hypothetical protein
MVAASGAHTFYSEGRHRPINHQLGDSSMKALSIVTAAIILGLSGAAMANDSGENHQDFTNTTGPNPFMPEFSTAAFPGQSAFAQYPVQHHIVHHKAKK